MRAPVPSPPSSELCRVEEAIALQRRVEQRVTTSPVVPPKEAESGVDYYMNLQAIQNLMGQL